MNGIEAELKPKYIQAWVMMERLKREMRGIPPLKAISAPWPMKKARAKVREQPQEIEIESKESLLCQTVTTPEPVMAPSAPVHSLVHPPSQSLVSSGKADGGSEIPTGVPYGGSSEIPTGVGGQEGSVGNSDGVIPEQELIALAPDPYPWKKKSGSYRDRVKGQ